MKPIKCRLIHVIVAAINANGEPDFYFCKVYTTPEGSIQGRHYEIAMQYAKDEGYDPKLAYDEFDTAGKALIQAGLFVWESATVIGTEWQ